MVRVIGMVVTLITGLMLRSIVSLNNQSYLYDHFQPPFASKHFKTSLNLSKSCIHIYKKPPKSNLLTAPTITSLSSRTIVTLSCHHFTTTLSQWLNILSAAQLSRYPTQQLTTTLLSQLVDFRTILSLNPDMKYQT
jgi:hypothetical protein